MHFSFGISMNLCSDFKSFHFIVADIKPFGRLVKLSEILFPPSSTVPNGVYFWNRSF